MKQSDNQSTFISDHALDMVMFDLLNGLKEFALERAFAKAKADLATLPQKWTQVKKCAELKLGHTIGCAMEASTNTHQVVNSQVDTVSALERDSTQSERVEKKAEKIIQFPTPVGPAKITT